MIENLKLIGDMVALEVVAKHKLVPSLDAHTGEPLIDETSGDPIMRKEYLIPTTGIVATKPAHVDVDFEIGDVVMLPSGNMIQLHDPEVVLNGVSEEDGRKYVATHYKNIIAIYG